MSARSSDLSIRKQDLELADVIIDWLRNRNGGELEEKFDDMTVRNARNLREELALILANGGRPPNWVPLPKQET